ncbi:hypothetical protein D2M30_0252 [Bacillus amyloliquefaciens]|nr:hypothetical protein D2M30_0252 [Bacillus amyloliquefaciens]
MIKTPFYFWLAVFIPAWRLFKHRRGILAFRFNAIKIDKSIFRIIL